MRAGASVIGSGLRLPIGGRSTFFCRSSMSTVPSPVGESYRHEPAGLTRRSDWFGLRHSNSLAVSTRTYVTTNASWHRRNEGTEKVDGKASTGLSATTRSSAPGSSPSATWSRSACAGDARRAAIRSTGLVGQKATASPGPARPSPGRDRADGIPIRRSRMPFTAPGQPGLISAPIRHGHRSTPARPVRPARSRPTMIRTNWLFDRWPKKKTCHSARCELTKRFGVPMY